VDRDPYANNPLFQAGLQAARDAVMAAGQSGQDPMEAARQAARQAVGQAAQPQRGPDGAPASPGDANVQTIADWLQKNKGLPPDQALAVAHAALPKLTGGPGG
jgi:hypothetical protein